MEDAELKYHLHLKKGDVGRYVLLPGDPGRCDLVARSFDNPKLIASNREFRTFTGTLLGEKVSVTSTGIGSPSTAIAVEELIDIGADTFIRIGTSGGMQPEQIPGELAICSAAIRDEGTTMQYMPPEFPAIADITVTLALKSAAEKLKIPYRVGITQSKDSFYGQHQPQRMPVAERLQQRWKAWKMGGAICSEMEAAAIFVLGSIYRKRTGGVMLISGNQESKDPNVSHAEDLSGMIATAVEALKLLIEQDRKEEGR